MATKVIKAEEGPDGIISAIVQFDDGYKQYVRVPNWATKKNIEDEAVRMREEAEAEAATTEREDLVD